jgi:serine/threonine protein kinase
MPLTAGERLGPYEILAPTGAGGMGEVWKARDTRLDRVVAIKVSKEKFSERFEHEARAVAALNHPHICTLHDVGPNYLVMEYVEGTPLKGPLPLEKAIEYAGQILDALDAAHQKGIIHRDMKPANILITKQGIKLLDFGLAKQAVPLKEMDPTRALTEQGQIVGTLRYMSPEQLQGKEADARSDLFAFGCVLYEMLSGKCAFHGSSTASVIAEILEREPAPLELAPPLERVIKTCLAKDPDQRFQNARDLKRDLFWALEPVASTAKPSRRWWVASAAAVTLAAAGGWAVSHFLKPHTDERIFRLQIDPPESGRFVLALSNGGLALSPDGKTAAFVASNGRKTGLWVRPLDSTSARLLVAVADVKDPFWSPDAKSIGFFSGGQLQRAELAGGEPFTICAVGGNSRGASWSIDGRIIFAALAASGLFQVPASGGTPSRLTLLDASRGERFHLWPQVLPGGRFLYWVRGDKPENTGVYVSSFAKPGERVRLLTSDTNALYAPGGDGKDYLLWLRGGTLYAQDFDSSRLHLAGEPHPIADPVTQHGFAGPWMSVAVSASGQLLYSAANTSGQFTWLDRSGKQLRLVGGPGEYTGFRLSPDGNRIVASRSKRNGADLWLLDVERGTSSRFTNNAGDADIYPVWSPSGRTIVNASGLAGHRLHFREADRPEGDQLTMEAPTFWYPQDWSRDGRLLLYMEVAPATGNDIWVLPVTPQGGPAEGAKPVPYLRTPSYEAQGRFSPETNPRWVAYVSDQSGRREVYIDTFSERRRRTPISTGGGQYPEWGSGGRELYYVSPDFKLMAVSVKLGVDSAEISPPRELFPLPTVDNGFSPYEPTPDGQRFLVRATPQQQAAEPLTVIVNWPALLKKGTAAQ